MASGRQAGRLLGRRIPVLTGAEGTSRNITFGALVGPNRNGLYRAVTASGVEVDAIAVGSAQSKDETLIVRTGPISWAVR